MWNLMLDLLTNSAVALAVMPTFGRRKVGMASSQGRRRLTHAPRKKAFGFSVSNVLPVESVMLSSAVV
jgi:hypothetical protein